MLTPEAIRDRIKNIDGSSWLINPDRTNPKEVWLGCEYGAIFEFFRADGPIIIDREREIDCFILYLRGKPKGRKQFMQKLIAVLGEPIRIITTRKRGIPLMVMWDAAKITL